jgi:quercetin dioxygenase-like cupin family protein/DNA-binding XRE family transcriptional regulator
LKKKLSLIDLGQRVDLSPSLLSQLEGGKLVPTLPTLARIGKVFGVDLAYFFAEHSSRPFSITRAKDLMRFLEPGKKQEPAYYFEVLGFEATEKKISPYLAEFPKQQRTKGNEHVHDGFELLYVIEGSLLIIHDGEEYVLHAGDTAHFDASAAHSYHGLSDPPARALVVTCP